MKITYYDKFAWLPRRCDCCNKLFWLESYNEKVRDLFPPVHFPICKQCVENLKPRCTNCKYVYYNNRGQIECAEEEAGRCNFVTRPRYEEQKIPEYYINGKRLKTFFNKAYNYCGEEIIRTIEKAANGQWEAATPMNDDYSHKILMYVNEYLNNETYTAAMLVDDINNMVKE